MPAGASAVISSTAGRRGRRRPHGGCQDDACSQGPAALGWGPGHLQRHVVFRRAWRDGTVGAPARVVRCAPKNDGSVLQPGAAIGERRRSRSDGHPDRAAR